ncbi:hypothetical protein AHAS_Ahas16G0084300 [Arachis hypogaea]
MALIVAGNQSTKPALVPISEKLEHNTFSTSRHMVWLTIQTLGMEHHLDPSKIPTRYESPKSKPDAAAKSTEAPTDSSSLQDQPQETTEYKEWRQNDLALATWLLASIGTTFKNKILNCQRFYEAWNIIINHFNTTSKTKVQSLKSQLKSVKKTGTITDYLAKIRYLVDSPFAIGYELQEDDHIQAIMDGLAEDYSGYITSVISRMGTFSQTKDLKCATHLLSEKFRNMSEEKKTIVRDLGFGGLMHILPLRGAVGRKNEGRNGGTYGHNPKRKRSLLRIHLLSKLNPIMDTVLWRRKLTCDRQKVTMSHLKHVNLESDDPSSQGHTDQSSVNNPAESMVYFRLSLVEESASEPAEENMMVVREETQSETLAINPAAEDAAALMMMARTASYVPKTDPMPSFSLGLTNSSQEEAATQEGASTQDGGRAKTPKTPKLLEQLGDLVQKIASGGMTTKEKSPQILKESGGESFEKFETPVRTNEDTSDMKEKCYLWTIRVKTYADGLTNEFDTVCTLQAQDRYILSKLHLASLAPETHIEAENMALENHPNGVFLQPKNNKPFRVEDYPMFIPFLDLKKLASHRYIFAPVFYSQHWWLWLADTRKQKFYIVDPYHTKFPSDERTALNTFITRDKNKEIEPPYLNISGQKTSYECAIYVMKWLEIFQPDEVDHFRVEYASRILFHEMNQDKAEAIRGSNAIRLSKPSSLLLSPYCQIDSKDIDSE